MSIYYIYQITNEINNKVYYGWTSNMHRRWTEHLSARKTIKHHLYSAMNKYGIDNFSLAVIAICPTAKDASKLEKLIIDTMIDKFPDQIYNKVQKDRSRRPRDNKTGRYRKNPQFSKFDNIPEDLWK